MSAAPLRVGLVGYGLGGAVFHAPLVAATPGLALAAVVTRDAERRAQLAREHPQARALDDAGALWAMAGELDLAIVTTPNHTHVALASAALDAGLPVVVDKPVAATAAEARALADRARERGLALVPYHNRRWDGDFRTVARLVREGALGTVHRFESRFERWRPTISTRAAWKERGGTGAATGILYDLGPHLVDQALVLFGPVARVYAEIDRRRAGAEVDDDVFLALEHASGTRSHLHLSALAAQPGPRFRVLGGAAAYVKHGLDPQEAALGAGARPGEAGYGEEPEAQWGTLGAEDDVRAVPTERGAYDAFYAGVAATVRDGAPPPVSIEDAIAGLEILEAAQRSAGSGGVVELGTHRA